MLLISFNGYSTDFLYHLQCINYNIPEVHAFGLLKFLFLVYLCDFYTQLFLLFLENYLALGIHQKIFSNL